MFPDQTIYTVNADVGLLHAILNGVAMVCSQDALVWGFAMLAAMWRLVGMTTAGALRSANGPGAGTGMTQNAVNLIVPFLFAIALTSSQLQTSVTVQSSATGTVTAVDNVPFIISGLPATASLLSQEVGGVVETAMQGTGTDYSSLSAAGVGFINPLKTLLTSRTAILKLGSIQSQVGSLIAGCIGPDAAVDHAQINRLVMNAGNNATGATGAGPGQSISVFNLTGTAPNAAPTAIGALLHQASLNQYGYVENIYVSGNPHMVGCADAANQVASNINDTLYSADFKRAVQGTVNSADVPNKTADYGVTSLSTIYTAVRTAHTATNTLTGGASQANAEMINLLFSEMVRNEMGCLKANGTNKAACLAMAVQANEIERNNIQSAANGVESLLYAGQFSNYITALIIGLGPIIVMFMMFAGMDSVKNMKAAAHMIVWPLLIMNVGAELINAMIYNSVANFMTTVAQSGYITQAVAVEVYKNFSMKIGTASHLIATLPILMTTIFALGQSAALVKISDTMGSNSKKAGEAATPALINSAPMVQNTSMVNAVQGINGSVSKASGAIDGIASSAKFGDKTREASHVMTATRNRAQSVSEGKKEMAQWHKAFETGNYSNWGLSRAEGDAIKKSYQENDGTKVDFSEGSKVDASKNNQNSASASANLGGSVGLGVGGFSAGAQVGGKGETATSSANQLSKTDSNGRTTSLTNSRALSKALDEHMSRTKSRGTGGNVSDKLSKSVNTAKEFSTVLSDTKSMGETTSDANKNVSGFTSMAAQITPAEYMHAADHGRDWNKYQLNEGQKFENNPAVQPYLSKAKTDVASGAHSQIQGNQKAHDAYVRSMAAVRLANDPNASAQDKFDANSYLVGASEAMLNMKFQMGDTSMQNHEIGTPTNRTGVDASGLIRAGDNIPSAKGGGNSAFDKAFDGKAGPVRDGVQGGVVEAGGIAERFDQNNQDAIEKGLGAHGPGTKSRTASGVAVSTAGGEQYSSRDVDKKVVDSVDEMLSEFPKLPEKRPAEMLSPEKRTGFDNR